jgi:hypothetical protein
MLSACGSELELACQKESSLFDVTVASQIRAQSGGQSGIDTFYDKGDGPFFELETIYFTTHLMATSLLLPASYLGGCIAAMSAFSYVYRRATGKRSV